MPRLHNWGGRFGAYLSDLLLFIFGLSAWWWSGSAALGCLVLEMVLVNTRFRKIP